MKQKSLISLIILLLTGTLCCFADKKEDSKYLSGAIPEIDGKVVLTRNIDINDKVSPNQIYELVCAWADTAYAEKEDSKQRILLKTPSENTIIVQGDDKLIFKSSLLSLDQADVEYRLTITVEQGKCLLVFSYLKYHYQDFKGYEKAENLITDKLAYNAKKNKLNRYYDRFRIFTIDQIDNITNDLKKYLGSVSNQAFSAQQAENLQNKNSIIPNHNTVSVLAPIVSESIAPAVPTQAITTETTTNTEAGFVGYKKLSSNKLSEGILEMIGQSRLIVNSNVDGQNITQLAKWDGKGDFGGQPICMITVTESSLQGSTGDTFTISFINKIHEDALKEIDKNNKVDLELITNKAGNSYYAEAWMIIECKKISQQTANQENKNKALSIEWISDKDQKKSLLMGEITQIWAR